MSEMMSKAAESRKRAESKGKGLGLVGNTTSSGAGAGGGFGLNAPGAGPKVTHFAGGGGGKKTLAVEDAVAEAWNRVMDDSQGETFVVAKYGATGKTLELKTAGTGGLADFKAELEDGVCMWAGFRCLAVDNRGSVVCKRPKLLFIQYMPDGASAMKKAKMGTHKGAVKEALHSAHLDLTVTDKDEELVEKDLCAKLQAATGAHKPNGYEFEKDVFVESDYYGLGIGKDCKST
mmetsp:Transcript_12099/g.37251  ORF Transcript_12099/g.37251 Transcript_12099/m.37251 type:complete len:233 (+) Transcript_12099:145-843(+)